MIATQSEPQQQPVLTMVLFYQARAVAWVWGSVQISDDVHQR